MVDLSIVFPLKMVIFHSYVAVYQRFFHAGIWRALVRIPTLLWNAEKTDPITAIVFASR